MPLQIRKMAKFSSVNGTAWHFSLFIICFWFFRSAKSSKLIFPIIINFGLVFIMGKLLITFGMEMENCVFLRLIREIMEIMLRLYWEKLCQWGIWLLLIKFSALQCLTTTILVFLQFWVANFNFKMCQKGSQRKHWINFL